MRLCNILKGTKGFVQAARYGVRLRDMVSDIALKRVKILSFWNAHGLKATVDAFGVKRSTLFIWKAKLNAGGGKLESLNAGSRAPKRRRTRLVDPRIVAFIVQERKRTYHRLGKEKLQRRLMVVCQGWGISCPSPSTVGRILSDLKKQGRLPHPMKLSFYGKTGLFRLRKIARRRKKVRRNGCKPRQPGDLLELDTVVKFVNGIKRYLICAVDLSSHFAFAYGYASLSSSTATDFFKKLVAVAPFPITHIQTDNGQEFERYFRGYLEHQQITHFHSYPKCPKTNAVVERFNRTVQQEHADYHLSTLAYDLPRFNRRLMEWLIWYNTERPHWSEGLHPPLYAVAQTVAIQKSNMLWTATGADNSRSLWCTSILHSVAEEEYQMTKHVPLMLLSCLLAGCGEEAGPGGENGGPAEGEGDGQELPPGVNPLPADRFCEEVVGLLFELDEWCGLVEALKTDNAYLLFNFRLLP